MAKKKIRKIRPQIHFEIEENAEQLLIDADVSEFAGDKDIEESVAARQSRRRGCYELDLHGLTLSESQQRIDALFNRILRAGQRTKVKIITGKGRHSRADTNLLARDVHVYVRQKYAERIVSIEQSPYAVRVGDLPIRGHFEVVIQ